jgi:hypothetical protein
MRIAMFTIATKAERTWASRIQAELLRAQLDISGYEAADSGPSIFRQPYSLDGYSA